MKKRKFNYVDITIIIIVIVVAIGGFMFLKKDSGETSFVSNNINVSFIAEADNITNEAVQQLQVGDAIVANGTFQDAYITSIEILDSGNMVAIDGQIQMLANPSYCKIRVTISGKANQFGPYIDLGGQEIKSGSRYYIKTDIFEAYGSVVKILEDVE